MNDRPYNLPLEKYEWDADELFRPAKQQQPFHIGQSYENAPAKQMQCSHCGGVEFHVGKGNFFTAVRCVKCRWELCIHNG